MSGDWRGAWARVGRRVGIPVVLLLWACSPPDRVRVPDGPPDLAQDGVCRAAHVMLDTGAWQAAVDELRVEATVDPAFAADPASDLCLGRALLGAGSADEARRLLEPMAEAPGVPVNVRRPACFYAAWAAGAQAGWDDAGQLLDRCESGSHIAAGELLLSGDAPALSLVRVAAWAALARLPDAAAEADAYLEAAPNDDASRQFLVRTLFSAAEAADPAVSPALASLDGALGPALAAWIDLLEAARRESWEEVAAALPEAAPALERAGAAGALERARAWAARAHEARALAFGAVLPLTGPSRPTGRAMLAGLLLAHGVFDPPSTGEAPQLWIRDSGASAESARAAVAALDELGVLALIGPPDDTIAEALRDEAERRGIPLLLLSDAVPPAPEGQWTFRFFATAEAEGQALADFLRGQGIFRAAVALPEPAPPYLERVADAFSAAANGQGIDVLLPERYDVSDLQGEADRVARSLAREDFEALLVADQPGRASTLAAYLAVHEIWGRPPGRLPSAGRREVVFLGNSFWQDPSFLAAGPDYLAGAVYPAWVPADLGYEATARFLDRFEAAFGRRPGVVEAFAHDAVALLSFLALDSGVRTRGGVRDGLVEADLVGAATGAIHFDAARQSDNPPFLLQIQSGGAITP